MQYGIRGLGIDSLGVEAECFSIAFPFEVIISLFFEILSDLLKKSDSPGRSGREIEVLTHHLVSLRRRGSVGLESQGHRILRREEFS